MQDPYPATFQRRHHNISLGAVFFCLHVNNNLSQKFAAKDISNGSLNQITTTGFYFGSNITEVTPYIKSHKWCLINAFVSDKSASIFVMAGDAMALSIYRNGDGVYSYYPIATKSDLTGIDAALSIREENGGVIVSFSSKDSKNGIYIGVGPNGVNANYKLNGEWKKAIIIATKS